MKHQFEIEFHGQIIQVENGDKYQLTWPDGRQLTMNTHTDPTEAVSGTISRQAIGTAWVIETKDGGPDWVNREQLQVIGELVSRKKHELQSTNKEEQVAAGKASD